eukprot:1489115-Pleurochrysis_carterae.AAC.1
MGWGGRLGRWRVRRRERLGRLEERRGHQRGGESERKWTTGAEGPREVGPGGRDMEAPSATVPAQASASRTLAADETALPKRRKMQRAHAGAHQVRPRRVAFPFFGFQVFGGC